MDRNVKIMIVLNGLSVALRKESVDRNQSTKPAKQTKPVALRKESVDRNMWWGVRKAVGSRRSPQGERG